MAIVQDPLQFLYTNRHVLRPEPANERREFYANKHASFEWNICNLAVHLKQNGDSCESFPHYFGDGNWSIEIKRDDIFIGCRLTKEPCETRQQHKFIAQCHLYIFKGRAIEYLHRDEYFVFDVAVTEGYRISPFPWNQLYRSCGLKIMCCITCFTCPQRLYRPEDIRVRRLETKRKYSDDKDVVFGYPIKKLDHTSGTINLLKDIWKFASCDKDCDITIKVEGHEFKAHCTILRARSPVFSRMFAHDTIERNTGIINIIDCKPADFWFFLKFMNYGILLTIPEDVVHNLYYLSEKYDVPELKKICASLISRCLSIQTFFENVKFSMVHTELFEEVSKFFVEYSTQITLSDQWGSFSVKYHAVAKYLLLKAANNYINSR